MVRNFKISDKSLIIFIVAAGAVLRFWRLPDIPFTHDEFSAILRTQFGSFHELIEKGIRIDGHPAGVQVFIYYLVKLLGVSEIVLKTPFILSGLASVYLVYLVGKKWFSSTTGLVAASFLSFLQYTVMYSQIARPYASGLFLALLLTFFWTNVVFNPEQKPRQNLAGFVISAALCAYDHHFCMLFAVMVGITGFFFLNRGNLKTYLLACLLALLLYIPHLPIFFYQLGVGGVEGWLQKPRFDFIFDYLQYVFHFSVFVYLLTGVIIVLSIVWYERTPPLKRKFILISAVWFILPYLVGFFYSKYRNAVLQNSVLIFSFPFLLFLLFGYFKTVRPKHQLILVSLIAVVLIPSLIFERKHYSVFYKNPYKEVILESNNALTTFGRKNCVILLDTKKEIERYYLKKKEFRDIPVYSFENFRSRRDFIRFVDTITANYLVFGCLSSTAMENYPVIMEKFPHLINHLKYSGGDFYIFSKTSQPSEITEYFSSTINNFETVPPEWNYFTSRQYPDSAAIEGRRSFYDDSTLVFSPTYSKNLRDMIKTRDDVIDVSADLRLDKKFPAAWMIATVTSKDKIITYVITPISDYMLPGDSGRAYISVRLSDVEFRHHAMKFSVYLWNPNHGRFMMDNFSVRVRSGNPVVYGLYRQIACSKE